MSNLLTDYPVEAILRSWLGDPAVTLFCGNWKQGSVMELLPRGAAELSGPRYEAPFEGVRELRLKGTPHHVHLDFGKLRHARYVLAPSVCYGFRPSFELRLTDKQESGLDVFAVGLALSHPYERGRLRVEPVKRYFRRVAEHASAFPGDVSVHCECKSAPPDRTEDWRRIGEVLGEMEEIAGPIPVLRAALNVEVSWHEQHDTR